ncbi:MAG TPA: hypothetical protein VK524_20920 [Polyangiaceae bacterium]|nr:hypothetical protein [Polyangiaceae bacterium]
MKNQLAIISLAALAAACSSAVTPEEAAELGMQGEALEIVQVPDDIVLPIDACRTADPDQIFYVLANSGALVSESKNGGYGYDLPCARWVVDYKIATYSPEWQITGEAWDLPSSSGANGLVPTNAHDCGRFATYVTFYRKKASETSFTNLGSGKFAGTWSSSSCKLTPSGTMTTAIAPPSTTGWDTWRIAVGSKLRTSWQETRAVGEQYIEPPK